MRTLLLGLALCVLAAAPDAALGGTVSATAFGPDGDLRVRLPGYSSQTHSPPSVQVARAGDANGDGRDDLVISRDGFAPGSHTADMRVIFTDPLLGQRTDYAAPGPGRGYEIRTGPLWFGLDTVGDVNGDGRDDLAFVTYDDTLVVVYGKTDGAPVDTAQLGTAGFRVEGVGGGVAIGNGGLTVNHAVTGVGDVDGDGRGDLVVRGGGAAATFVRSPPPGTTVRPGDVWTRRIVLPERATDALVSDVGDQDGDGRHELLIGATLDDPDPDVRRGAAWILSLAGTGPVDAEAAVAAGRGTRFTTSARQMPNVLPLGDQDGDGRTDPAFLTYTGGGGRVVTVAYAPALGARIDLDMIVPPSPRGFRIRPYGDIIVDVGDQDGDGRDDLASSSYVRFLDAGARASEGEMVDVQNRADVVGGFYLSREAGEIAGTLRDFTADGKPELVTVRDTGSAYGNPPYTSQVQVNVFESSPAPLLPELPPPVDIGDILQLPVTLDALPGVVTDPTTVALRPAVELVDASGITATWRGALVRAARGRQQASVAVPVADAFGGGRGLVAGRTYRYRLTAESGRGLTGRTALGSFVFRAPGAASAAPAPSAGTKPGTATKPGMTSGAPKRGVTLKGTRRKDRLVGTRFADVLSGARGNDVLEGRGGADRLTGGPGRDRLDGGTGADMINARDGERDVVRCGPGTDRATVDRRDDVKGCERVLRPRS